MLQYALSRASQNPTKTCEVLQKSPNGPERRFAEPRKPGLRDYGQTLLLGGVVQNLPGPQEFESNGLGCLKKVLGFFLHTFGVQFRSTGASG